jgi:hypothetical protein
VWLLSATLATTLGYNNKKWLNMHWPQWRLSRCSPFVKLRQSIIAALPCGRIVFGVSSVNRDGLPVPKHVASTADIAVSFCPTWTILNSLSHCFWLKFVHVLIRFRWSGVRGRRYFVLESAIRWTLIRTFLYMPDILVRCSWKLSAAHGNVKAWRKLRRRHLSQFKKNYNEEELHMASLIMPLQWLFKMWYVSSVSESFVPLSSRSMCIFCIVSADSWTWTSNGGNSDMSLSRSLQGESYSIVKRAVAKLYCRTTKNCGRLSGHQMHEVCPGY